MKRLSVFALVIGCGVLQGCLSDCSISEATGVAQSFNAGCSSSGFLDGDSLQLSIDSKADHELLDEVGLNIPGPIVIGARGSTLATIQSTSDLETKYGSGVADYVVTDIRPKEGTKDAFVDIDFGCPQIDTALFGHGSFKAKSSVIVFNFDF